MRTPTPGHARHPGAHRSRGGFTLIELMAALAVLAIVLCVAAPSFASMMATQRVRSAALDLSSALLLARSEAVKRNGTVSVAAVGGVWTKGWQVSAGAETVRTFGALSSVAVTPSGGTSFSVGNDGRLPGGALNFQLAPDDGAQVASTVCVLISETGRVATATGACS